jgi:NodT family efflux transporter outer membrane factor (OMF) lipoprotein
MLVMKEVKLLVWIFLLIGATTMLSCKSLNTRISIPENKIPEQYTTGKTDTQTVARLPWSTYFNDADLVRLIEKALSNNFDVKMTYQNLETYKAQIKLARGAQLPTVNATTAYWQRKFGFYTMDDAGNRVTEIAPGDTIPTHLPDYYIGLTATWEVDIWGRLKKMRQSAMAQYLASVEGKHFVISNLIAEMANLYYALLALDNELDLIKQTIQKQEEAIRIVEAQLDGGKANALALKQFQAQLLASKVIQASIDHRIQETENRLNFLMGQYPQPIKRNKEQLFQTLNTNYAVGIPSQLLVYRPDIRSAAHLVEASKFNLEAAKASFYPTLNITAGLGFQAFNPQFLFSTPASLAYSALGGLVAPLINRNALKARFNTAKAQQLNALYQYQQSVLNGYVDVSNALSYLNRLSEMHDLRQEQSLVLKETVTMSTELYQYAKANYLEVLLAQQNALQARLDYIELVQQQQQAKVRLYKALGGGWMNK